MKTVFLRMAICFMSAIGLCACGGGEGSSTAANGTLGYYAVGESGTRSSPWGDASAVHKPAMAVKFTPSSYPVTITSVTIYAVNNTGADQLFNVYGFDENLSTETTIFSTVTDQVLLNNGTSCFQKTVNIPATTISSGSFHIAIEWVTKPLTSVSGANAFFLCTDSALNHTNTSFFRYVGNTWVPLESISATGGDLGILVN